MRKLPFILLFNIIFVIIIITGINYSSIPPNSIKDLNASVAADNDWLFLVYIAADNNLEEFAIMDINELEGVEFPSNVKVVVQIDRHEEYDTSNDDWTGTRRYLISRDLNTNDISSQMVEDLGELNMGAPNILRDFVSWSKSTFPATHSALILWDHGNGWSDGESYNAEELFFEESKSKQIHSERENILTDNIDVDKEFFTDSNVINHDPIPQKVVCSDDHDNDELTINEIQLALTGFHFDIIGIDACLMGTMEIAYEFSPFTDYFVASEENIPGYGWPYREITQHLATNSMITPGEFASLIVDDYMATYRTGGLYHVADATLSAINLTMMDSVIEVTNDFFGYLIDNKANYDASNIALSIDECSSYYYYQIDYLAFIYKLKENLDSASLSQLDTYADNLISVLEDAVVNAEYNEEHPDAYSMSIFAPKYKEHYKIAYEYACDDWREESLYDDFIKGFSSSFGSLFDSMTPIESGVYTGSLALDEIRYYKFTADQAQTRITVTLEYDVANDFDLTLYDKNFARIDYSYYDNPETVTGFSLESDALFSIMIDAYSGSGNYTMEISEIISTVSKFDFDLPSEIQIEELDSDKDKDAKIDDLLFTIPIEITGRSEYTINYVFTTLNSEKIYVDSIREVLDEDVTAVLLSIPSINIYKLNLTNSEDINLHLQLKNIVGDVLDRKYNATKFSVNSEDYQTPLAYFPNIGFNSNIEIKSNGINIGLPVYIREYGSYYIEFSVLDLTEEVISYVAVTNYFNEETSNSLQMLNLTVPAGIFNSSFEELYYFDHFNLIKNETYLDSINLDLTLSKTVSNNDFQEENVYGVNWRTNSEEGLVIWDLSLATDNSKFIFINYYLKINSGEWQEITVEENGIYKLINDEFGKDLQFKFEITLTVLGSIENYEILSPILNVEKSSSASGFEGIISIVSFLSIILIKRRDKRI